MYVLYFVKSCLLVSISTGVRIGGGGGCCKGRYSRNKGRR